MVLERRDSAEREDSRDLGLEKSAQPHCQTFPGPPHSHCSFQLAELIHTPPCLMTLISTKEEPKQEAPKEEKAHPPWVPPLQHNFLKNWQRNIALRKKQQEALSGEQSGQDACLASALRLCCCVFSPPSPAEPGFRLVAFVLSAPKCFLYLLGHEVSPVTGADQRARAPTCSDLVVGLHSWFSLERLKKPVSELLMHTGETYRQIQEERELLDRMLSTRSDGKVRTVHPVGGVWTAGDKKISIYYKALLNPQGLY